MFSPSKQRRPGQLSRVFSPSTEHTAWAENGHLTDTKNGFKWVLLGRLFPVFTETLMLYLMYSCAMDSQHIPGGALFTDVFSEKTR